MPESHNKLTKALLNDDWAAAEAMIEAMIEAGEEIDPEDALPFCPEKRALLAAVQPPYYPNLARALVRSYPEAGEALLSESFCFGWAQRIKPLLEAGVNPSFCDIKLHKGILDLKSKLEVVDLLLEHGADPKEDDSYFLCDAREKPLFRRLVDAGASVPAALKKMATDDRAQDFKIVFNNAWDEKLITIALLDEIIAGGTLDEVDTKFLVRKRRTLEDMKHIQVEWCDQTLLAAYQSATLEEINAKFVACAGDNDKSGLFAMLKLGANDDDGNAALRNAVKHEAWYTIHTLATFCPLDTSDLYHTDHLPIVLDATRNTLKFVLDHCPPVYVPHLLNAALHKAVVNRDDSFAREIMSMGGNPFSGDGLTAYIIERRTDAPELQAALQAWRDAIEKGELARTVAQGGEPTPEERKPVTLAQRSPRRPR